jgi:hypothetical protein
MPISIVRYLKEDELSSPEGVHSLYSTALVTNFKKFSGTYRECERSYQSADEAPPHSLVGEVVAHFLERQILVIGIQNEGLHM